MSAGTLLRAGVAKLSIQFRAGMVRLVFAFPEGGRPSIKGQEIESFEAPMTAQKAMELAAELRGAAERAFAASGRTH